MLPGLPSTNYLLLRPTWRILSGTKTEVVYVLCPQKTTQGFPEIGAEVTYTRVCSSPKLSLPLFGEPGLSGLQWSPRLHEALQDRVWFQLSGHLVPPEWLTLGTLYMTAPRTIPVPEPGPILAKPRPVSAGICSGHRLSRPGEWAMCANGVRPFPGPTVHWTKPGFDGPTPPHRGKSSCPGACPVGSHPPPAEVWSVSMEQTC